MRLASLLAVAACALAAADQPIRVSFQCAEDDVQAFGLDCTADEPCAVFLELTGVEMAGSRIFAAGNLHTATTTLFSILLASQDEGKTWTEPHERIRSAGLEQIQFVDFERGWVAGQNLQAVPRDPFFLMTTDGGKSWRRRAVAGEGQVGAIEQFWFASRADGLVVIDRMQSAETGARYSIYESRTGGEGWSIREVSSRPLKLKQAAGQSALIRLRADARSKAYVIERRAGEKWQAAASFPIEIGACLPPPQAPAPMPPEPEEAEPAAPPALKKKPRG